MQLSCNLHSCSSVRGSSLLLSLSCTILEWQMNYGSKSNQNCLTVALLATKKKWCNICACGDQSGSRHRSRSDIFIFLFHAGSKLCIWTAITLLTIVVAPLLLGWFCEGFDFYYKQHHHYFKKKSGKTLKIGQNVIRVGIGSI